MDRPLSQATEKGHFRGETLDFSASRRNIHLTAYQEQAKTRRRRQIKSQRAVVGASLDVIKERRAMRPEVRAAARKEDVNKAKEKRAAAQSAKKAEKAKTAATRHRPQGSDDGTVSCLSGWLLYETWLTGDSVVGKQAAKGSAPKPKPTTR